MTAPILFFAYGTLKRGYMNHHHLSGCVFRGEATVVGSLWWWTSAIPIARVAAEQVLQLGRPGDGGQLPPVRTFRKPPTQSAGMIQGELFEVGPASLEQLDYLEGFDDGPLPDYLRVATAVFPRDGAPAVAAWIYIDPQPEKVRVPLIGGLFA